MPVGNQPHSAWLLLDAGNSAPGPHGLTSRMDVFRQVWTPRNYSQKQHHVLPTPCAYMHFTLPIPSAPRSPQFPFWRRPGGRQLKRLEGCETMLDDTSPSGTCDLQKETAHHAQQHSGPRNDSRRLLRLATGPWGGRGGSHTSGPLFLCSCDFTWYSTRASRHGPCPLCLTGPRGPEADRARQGRSWRGCAS